MKLEDIEKVWTTSDAIHLRTKDGREASERFAEYARLAGASQAVRERYELDRWGIHWPDVDEDFSFDGFFEKKPTAKTEVYTLVLPVYVIEKLERKAAERHENVQEFAAELLMQAV
jgi:hypothetical protein